MMFLQKWNVYEYEYSCRYFNKKLQVFQIFFPNSNEAPGVQDMADVPAAY